MASKTAADCASAAPRSAALGPQFQQQVVPGSTAPATGKPRRHIGEETPSRTLQVRRRRQNGQHQLLRSEARSIDDESYIKANPCRGY